ncbi:MAG TPA: glycosyltransferase family 2 protein, partial [Gammaproteobacteria bacterium]|nr:glycosyltransferase family 2 protein [Gammaproteobacteria bacterium]
MDECLGSLEKQSLNANIVVVDNASTDDSVKIVRKHTDVDLVELSHNRGFAGGVNAGIGFALAQGADFVALFNNDAVADKDWLKNLVDAAKKDKKIGIVTCKLLHFDGKKIDSTGDFYSSWGFPFPRGRDEKEEGQYDGQREIFSGSGGASLYRAEMLKEVGLFDEDFFAYFEDVDLGFRAQLAGWKAVYEPSAKAFHRIGGTSS